MAQKITQESLLFWLQERYDSIQIMRNRVQSITLRLLWILLWVSWRLAQGNISFNCCEKITVVTIIIILTIVFYKYFENIKIWANKQRDIAAKIEDKLWFFEGKDSIYPKQRKDKNENRPFLKYHYIMLWFGFWILILSILYFA
jgi:Ca2+/Na+ antiporter